MEDLDIELSTLGTRLKGVVSKKEAHESQKALNTVQEAILMEWIKAKKLKLVHKEMKKHFRLINKMLTQTGSIFKSPDGVDKGGGGGMGVWDGHVDMASHGEPDKGMGRCRTWTMKMLRPWCLFVGVAEGVGLPEAEGKAKGMAAVMDKIRNPKPTPMENKTRHPHPSTSRTVMNPATAPIALREISPVLSLAALVVQMKRMRMQRRLRLSGSIVTAGCKGTWSSR
ncbi:hypothetical protein C8R44DRAFT_752170 [Mycena epipterygia]|nr:hypothetical protein C8R44DRAFT_752170 [Mycena epipterygia]